MRIGKAFRFRLYPTDEQVATLDRWSDALRFLWNLAHEQRLSGMDDHVDDDKRYYSAFDQINQLTELRAELPWLAEVPRNVSAQLLVELDEAWQRCFKKLARKPHWRAKGRDLINFCESHPKVWWLKGERLHFPKLGILRIVAHRPLEGTPKTCTIVRDGDQWFAAIVCVIEKADPIPRSEPIIALDRGLINFVADSNDRRIENPRRLKRALRRLAHAQRVVSRRKKGSRNQEKARIRVMRLHRKVRRQRDDFVHRLSHHYAESQGRVIVERLNVRGMLRNHHLARDIADAGWGKLLQFLRYKLAWNGGTLVEVVAAYSSQTCSVCGYVDAANRHGEVFRCLKCDHTDHADTNAAKVLLLRGTPVETTGAACGGYAEVRRPAKQELRVVRRGQRLAQGTGPSFSANAPAFRPG